ncbi:MAG: hypothetical protein K8R77_12780, partial [Anaerolineaceae bacterium]|nr:hypothetical protein [Anaerolineaceae bacterium]
MQEKELLNVFIDAEVKNRDDLTPSRLALISLGHEEYYSPLRERAQFLIDDGLQKRASGLFKSICESGRQVSSLQEACLTALGARELWRLSQNWKDVFTQAGFFDVQIF